MAKQKAFKITNTAGEVYHVYADKISFERETHIRFYDEWGDFTQAFLATSVLAVEKVWVTVTT